MKTGMDLDKFLKLVISGGLGGYHRIDVKRIEEANLIFHYWYPKGEVKKMVMVKVHAVLDSMCILKAKASKVEISFIGMPKKRHYVHPRTLTCEVLSSQEECISGILK